MGNNASIDAGGRWMRRIVIVLLASFPVAAQTQLPPAATARIDSERDVKPLLAENCYSCHGSEVQQAGLRLDLRQAALRGGDYGPVIVPGKSADSKLIKRLVDGDGGTQMPPSGPLSPEDIDILKCERWGGMMAPCEGGPNSTERSGPVTRRRR